MAEWVSHMVVGCILVLYAVGTLVAYTCASLVLEMASYQLTDVNNVVFGCDYKDPKTSTRFASSAMACSSLYTSSAIQNNMNLAARLSFVESIQELSVVKGIRCFKLELVTACRQRWLQSNEESRYYHVKEHTRDECMAANTCRNCEIANNYASAVCEVFTFGWNDIKKTVVFTTEVPVYQNLIGRSEYGGKSSYDDVIDIGGTYSEKVYFVKAQETLPKVNLFMMNPATKDLLSLTMRRLLKFSGEVRSYLGINWYLYDNNHLFHKDQVDSTAASLTPRVLSCEGPGRHKKRSRSCQRKLQLAQNSQQAYNEYFTAAQLNVTTWYLNYLDCRLKKMSFGIFTVIKSFQQQLNIDPSFIEEELIDLSPGEKVMVDNINKYACYRVVFGSIVSQKNCLVFKDDTKTLNITRTGEITAEPTCCKSLRINSTHILSTSSSNMVEMAEYSFPSLIEEEEILKYPPNITSTFAHLQDIIKNSVQLNARDTGGSLKLSTAVREETPDFITKFTNGSFFKWNSVFSSLLTWIIVAIIVYYTITRYLRHRRDREASNPRTIFIERETRAPTGEVSFEVT